MGKRNKMNNIPLKYQSQVKQLVNKAYARGFVKGQKSMRREIIEFRCNKCHNLQDQDDKQSNENWAVFKTNEKCKCGGKYVLFVNGKEL